MVQRGHVFAIVDEVDSILIDEARTPLIISGPADEAAQLYYQFASIARTLTRDVDYEVDEEKQTVVPLESGIEKVEKAVGVENLYDDVSVNYVHQLTKALEAKELYKRDKDYLVADGEVKIVDEFTGRTLEGRRWSDGLHQAVEAKERVRIKEENHTWATVTLQNYFRLYEKLAGMTGTAETEAGEFAGTYGALGRADPDEQGRWSAATTPTSSSRPRRPSSTRSSTTSPSATRPGQPVLVGTASVAKSELLSRLLEKRGIPHQVLNAKQHFREAEVVAQAGRLRRGHRGDQHGRPRRRHHPRRQPRAAGRSTSCWPRASTSTREEGAGALGRAPRPRSSSVPGRGRGGPQARRPLRARVRAPRVPPHRQPAPGPFRPPGRPRREPLLPLPGDELLRLFATGAMSWVMGRALPEDVPIESKMVAKAIERAQNTVEGRNAEMRKDVLKYDEVMNEQRKVIYERRLQIIDGEDLEAKTEDLLAGGAEALVAEHCPTDFAEDWDLEGLVDGITQYYPTKFTRRGPRAGGDHRGPRRVHRRGGARVLRAARLVDAGRRGHDAPDRARRHAADHRPRWRDHLAEMDNLKDGIHLRWTVQADPLDAWQQEGFNLFGQLLELIDNDYLRYILHVEAVQPAASEEPDLDKAVYAAADDPWSRRVVGRRPGRRAWRAGAGADDAALAGRGDRRPGGAGRRRRRERVGQRLGQRERVGRRRAPGRQGADQDAERPRRRRRRARWSRTSTEKVGRNEPCWCGSGKKFKFCHGAA